MQYIAFTKERAEDIVQLWNEEISEEFPLRKELFEQNSLNEANVSFSGSQVALDEKGNVIGFIIAKRLKEDLGVTMNASHGWIQSLLVSRPYRGKGIGSTLLKSAETSLREKGIKKIQLGGDLFHYFPGISDRLSHFQQWAEKKGYVKLGDTYDLLNPLEKTYHSPADEALEYVLLQKNEEREFIAFLNKSFPGRWTYEAKKYFEMNGSGKEFLVAKKNGSIIGFCRINGPDSPYIPQNLNWSTLFQSDTGGIGPLGIAEEEQKQGYGLDIVKAGMVQLQEKGVSQIIIDWTDLLDFYGKLDFKVWKKYGIYMKESVQGEN